MKRPDVFEYLDYRELLRDWLDYLKSSQSDFSLRKLAKECGVSLGYIPNILKGYRNLTSKNFIKIKDYLNFNEQEKEYILTLINLEKDKKQESQEAALKKLQKYKSYSKNFQSEAFTQKYLSKWYNVLIREMSYLTDFTEDPKWIQKRIIFPISQKQIEDSLKFLKNNNLLNDLRKKEKDNAPLLLECMDKVFKPSLKFFYKQSFDLAKEAIDRIESKKRYYLGHSVSLSENNFKEAKKIMDKALKEIQELEEKTIKKENTYQFMMQLFPLTQKTSEDPNEDH